MSSRGKFIHAGVIVYQKNNKDSIKQETFQAKGRTLRVIWSELRGRMYDLFLNAVKTGIPENEVQFLVYYTEMGMIKNLAVPVILKYKYMRAKELKMFKRHFSGAEYSEREIWQ